jgi:hypothetical protein
MRSIMIPVANRNSRVPWKDLTELHAHNELAHYIAVAHSLRAHKDAGLKVRIFRAATEEGRLPD